MVCDSTSYLCLRNIIVLHGLLSKSSTGDKKDPYAFGWRERYKVAVGVAEALDYIHNGCAEPIIHKDVKSSNILLSDDFEPQVLQYKLFIHFSTST